MTGWDVGSAGIEPGRVAELLVTPVGQSPGRRGSGYRVSASAVLTAAHVVLDAARVRVRFNADRPGEWLTEGTVAWSDPTVDVAVVTITPRPQDEGRVTPVGFGRVAERDAVLACSAMGFPRFKLRNDPGQPLDDGSPSQYRDSVHTVGTIAVLSNRREGTLELSVSPPERDPDPQRSPWEGMSGAAVWSNGRIIGLVARHYRSDGLGRLAATRIDRWYERVPRERLDLLRVLLPMLPDHGSRLADVVPPTPRELLKAGHTAQVRQVAPRVLLDRDDELAELVQFCAGEERYLWWQARAWAGKTALAAWFVLHPPAGVTIASFFVTRRFAGEADSDAFTQAMIEQLAAVAGESSSGAATPEGRDRERQRLLEQAAKHVGERHERLLLVVDGLDEDEGAQPGGGKPSIASRLPARVPDSVRVLVTSRPSPGIPDDVPSKHPLRHCRQRALTPSPHAEEIEVEAKRELLQRLHGDQLQVDVIGFITAAGGGLTLRELAELTARPEWTLKGRLGSVFGRSLSTRTPADRPSEDAADRVFLFAHETLRVIAEQHLANDLGPYRQRIDAWADTYRAQGWPESTPPYLLRPYGRLLATSGNLQRLVTLATDPVRQDRMLAYTQGDAAALAEITMTQQLILRQRMPDLVALGRLAVHQDRLGNRNWAVPEDLPAVWVSLGQAERGEALARCMTNPDKRAQALAALAQTMVEVDRDRALALAEDAEQATRSITYPDVQARALRPVVQTFADTGRWDRAEQTAFRIADPHKQAGALHHLVEALARAGQWDRAEQTARHIPNSSTQWSALGAVVKAMVEVDRDRALALADDAEQAASSLTDSRAQSWALYALVEALARAGQWDRAEQTARRIPDSYTQMLALGALAETLAGAGQWSRAEQVARSITDPSNQAEALSSLAKAIVAIDRDRALALADGAEQVARSITDPSNQAEALSSLAKAIVAIDRDRALALADGAERAARRTPPSSQPWTLSALAKAMVEVAPDRVLALADDAEQAVSRMTDSEAEIRLLRTLAEALAGAGQWDRAEQIARSIWSFDVRAWALRDLVEALAAAKEWEHAEETARSIRSHPEQVQALGAVVEAMIEVDRDRALALADDAVQIAHSLTDLSEQVRALQALAEALARAGLWDRAQHAAYSITKASEQARVLTEQARVLSVLARAAGKVDPDRASALADAAERIARRTTNPTSGRLALVVLADAMADAGHWDYAEQTVRRITDPDNQAFAMRGLVEALAGAGQWDRAEQTALGITNRSEQVRALTSLAEALARAGQWDRAEQTTRHITSFPKRALALNSIAEVMGQVDREQASALADDPMQLAHSLSRSALRSWAHLVVVKVLAGAGQWDRAQHTARRITNRPIRAKALSALARAMRKADGDRVLAPATHAAQTARSRTGPSLGSWAFTSPLASAGRWDRADEAIRRITDPEPQAKAHARRR